jgi:hypothetical protein
MARAASASACQACPMSCKQYRYARSRYFHASRHAMLVRTNTIGAGAAGQLHFEIAQRALLGHVRRGTVMIQPIGPLLQASCEEVEFGRVQIPGGWIHAQRVPVSGGRNALGRADRSGIEQQLRKERRAVAGRVAPETRQALRAPAFQGLVDLPAGRAPARPRSDGTDRAYSPSRERAALASTIQRCAW